MSFWGLFKKNRKSGTVKLSKRQDTAFQNAAAAAAFAEAGEHDTANSLTDPGKGQDTILVIGRQNGFSERLAAYAVAMAGRLDFKLLALNITEAPLSLSSEKKEEAIAAFKENCLTNCAHLHEKAQNAGIHLSHRMEVGIQDEIIEQLHLLYPGMRYVLTEPDPEVAEKDNNASIPVFDLDSYQGVAA